MSRLTESSREGVPVVYWIGKDKKREGEEKICWRRKLIVAPDGLDGMRNVGIDDGVDGVDGVIVVVITHRMVLGGTA